ncbi:MAG: hypothetical protein WAV40_03585 [Microgenomates group bacterium]
MTKYIHEATVIGMGSLGTALMRRFDHSEVVGTSRNTPNYFQQILESKILLLCMKQGDILTWLDKYTGSLNDENIVISFGAALNLSSLASHTRNQSLTLVRAMTNKGIAYSPQNIVWTSESVLEATKTARINQLFNHIGNSYYVGVGRDRVIDKETHKACDMGRIAYLLNEYQQSLVTGLEYLPEEAVETIIQSLGAVMQSLRQGESLDQIARRVASKGGITEASNGEMGEISSVFRLGMKAASAKMRELNNQYK